MLSCWTVATEGVEGVRHGGVADMPGGVAGTSTLALNNATLPDAGQAGNKGGKQARKDNPALRKGLNGAQGKVTYAGVAEAFGMEFHPPEQFLA